MPPDNDEEIDGLAQEYDRFLEKQRNEFGIDEFVKIAGLSPEQDRFIEDLLLNPHPNESENNQQFGKLLVRLLLAIQRLHQENLNIKYREEQEQKKRKSNRIFAVQFFVVAGVIIALLTFRHTEFTADPGDGSVFAIESSWWGFVKKHREIKWITTDDYDSPGWMARGEDGKWYLYMVEKGELWE